MSMMRGRRNLVSSGSPNSLERALRKLSRRVQKIERAPVRATLIATPVVEVPVIATPPPAGGLLFVFTEDIGTTQVMARYREGNWNTVGNPFTGVDFSSQAGSLRKLGESIWLSVYQDGYYRSDDGGISWTLKLAHNLDEPPLTPNIDADGRLWAIAPNGDDHMAVFRSDDNGENWTEKLDIEDEAPSDFDYIHSVACHPSDGDQIAVFGKSSGDNPHLYITEDGGTTWDNFELPDTRDYVSIGECQMAEFSASGRLLLVYEMDNVGGGPPFPDNSLRCQYSDDAPNSASYTAVDILAPGGTDGIGWGYTPIGGGPLLVSAAAHFVLFNQFGGGDANMQIAYSDDDGATWTAIANPVDSASFSGIYYDAENDVLFAALYDYQNPLSPPIIWALAGASTGGSGWSDITSDLFSQAGLSSYGPTFGIALGAA